MRPINDFFDGLARPSRSKPRNPWRRALTITYYLLGTLFAVFYAFAVMTSPFPFYSNIDGAVIRIDGVSFLRGKGRMYLYPWKWVYDVEVETPTEVVRKRLYPWAEGSDSGSIHIDKEGVSVYAETQDIGSRRK